MQHSSYQHPSSPASLLRNATIQQLLPGKGRLVEVPYTASVQDTLHALLAHHILAVPVAAPPGHWIGAGGSTILESDKTTGAARKQYIGMVSVLDILIYLSQMEGPQDAESFLSRQISTVIGQCVEGLSLWALGPHTSLYEALDLMSRGVHRVLVPLYSQLDHTGGLELEEASPGYRLITQTDLIRFILAEAPHLQSILQRDVKSLGAVQTEVVGVVGSTPLKQTLKYMTQLCLNAIAVLGPTSVETEGLVPANGKALVATFSASDLRGCSAEALIHWSDLGVLAFLRKIHLARKFGIAGALMGPDLLNKVDLLGDIVRFDHVTCSFNNTLEEVMKNALDANVHRVWILDEECHIQGVITFSDILRVVRQCIRELENPQAI